MRILVVEDEPKAGDYLRNGLIESGYAADLARDGAAGFCSLALATRYDAIVLDVMLPGLDGWQLLARLREQREPPPVLFLSARGTLEDRLKGLELGADDYLVKPLPSPNCWRGCAWRCAARRPASCKRRTTTAP